MVRQMGQRPGLRLGLADRQVAVLVDDPAVRRPPESWIIAPTWMPASSGSIGIRQSELFPARRCAIRRRAHWHAQGYDRRWRPGRPAPQGRALHPAFAVTNGEVDGCQLSPSGATDRFPDACSSVTPSGSFVRRPHPPGGRARGRSHWTVPMPLPSSTRLLTITSRSGSSAGYRARLRQPRPMRAVASRQAAPFPKAVSVGQGSPSPRSCRSRPG